MHYIFIINKSWFVMGQIARGHLLFKFPKGVKKISPNIETLNAKTFSADAYLSMWNQKLLSKFTFFKQKPTKIRKLFSTIWHRSPWMLHTTFFTTTTTATEKKWVWIDDKDRKQMIIEWLNKKH